MLKINNYNWTSILSIFAYNIYIYIIIQAIKEFILNGNEFLRLN